MTIIDCCISLKMIKKKLVVLGVVDMRQHLLSKISSDDKTNVNCKKYIFQMHKSNITITDSQPVAAASQLN